MDVKSALQELETASETETSERQAAIADILDGTTFTGSLVINRDYPDLELKSNGEKRLLFTDAGGAATSAVKNSGTSMTFFAGGVGGSDLQMTVATDGVDIGTLKLDGTVVSATAAELNYTGDLGTFTKDIISDNSDVKDALQELESAVASIQGAAKVHNYKWSNNNDATITAQHITTDAANWADATKVYIHRQARHSVDMQNAFNNMLLVGAKLYIQRTDVGDKFFTAIINSAATITGTGTDQVFAYDVTDVSTIGQVFNEDMRVNVGVFSNVNQKMLDDVQADVDANEAAAAAAVTAEETRALAAEALLAPLASPALTGTPTAPTAGAGTNTTQVATTAFVSTAVANVIDAAPGALDTLNELAAALGDDANFSTTITNSIAAVQADVDQNEIDSDAAEAALSGRLDTLEADPTTQTALDAVQADVDANEAASDAAEAALSGRLDTLEADPTTATAVAAVQADVDQNEADADAAIALKANKAGDTFTGVVTVQDHLIIDDSNNLASEYNLNVKSSGSSTFGVLGNGAVLLGNNSSAPFMATEDHHAASKKYVDDADTALDGRLDVLEADPVTQTYVDATTNTEAITRQAQDTTLQSNIDAVQADVDQNEADADAAIALKANIASPTFTGTPAAPTAAAGTNTTQLATTAFVTSAVSDLVDAAPGALDTLNELAAAIGDDANFSTTVTNLVAANEVHIDNLATLSGVAKDSQDLATFSGSTISDNGTIKAALQELETAVEASQSNSDVATQVKTQVTATNSNHYLTFVDSNNVSNTAEALRTGANIKFNPSTKILDISSGTVHAQYLTLDNVNLTATALELNVLDGITATTAELNYTDGVTSNIQTQLDAKAATTALTAATDDISDIRSVTGTSDGSTHLGTFSGSTITDNVSIKVALNELEAAQEATQADVNQNESDADAAIAAVLAGTSIPGPYNNDSDAATGGVAVGAIYKNSNGSIHWRVS